MKGTKVYVAQNDERLLGELCELLEGLELEVVGRTVESKSIAAEVKALGPDLIVSGMHFDDGNGVDALLEVADHNPVPAVIVAKQDDLDDVEKAMDDHVMGYLIDPVDPRDLRSTCYLVLRRFEEFQELRKENDVLKEALVTRKKLERAKGILMEKYGISEEDAYLRIRNVATKKRMKLAEVSDILIEGVAESE